MSELIERSLEEQRNEYKKRRLIAMPIAGTIMWAVVGLGSSFLSTQQSAWLLFIAVGSIFYLGVFISKFTGEHLLDRSKPKNTFDSLFLQTVVMSLLVFALAIPFFRIDYTSLPLTIGILTGLMWVPQSWVLGHWVGLFHGVSRTLLVLTAWYLWPHYRFQVIPLVIVILYLVTIGILNKRWRNETSK